MQEIIKMIQALIDAYHMVDNARINADTYFDEYIVPVIESIILGAVQLAGYTEAKTEHDIPDELYDIHNYTKALDYINAVMKYKEEGTK